MQFQYATSRIIYAINFLSVIQCLVFIKRFRLTWKSILWKNEVISRFLNVKNEQTTPDQRYHTNI
jgi:hypothetical protein